MSLDALALPRTCSSPCARSDLRRTCPEGMVQSHMLSGVPVLNQHRTALESCQSSTVTAAPATTGQAAEAATHDRSCPCRRLQQHQAAGPACGGFDMVRSKLVFARCANVCSFNVLHGCQALNVSSGVYGETYRRCWCTIHKVLYCAPWRCMQHSSRPACTYLTPCIHVPR